MAEPRDHLVVFSPAGKRGRFAEGTPLLQAARSLGVDIDSVCGGRAICGRCQVAVTEGELAKHGIVSRASSLAPAGEAEQRFRERRGLAGDRRLSCQALILGDVAIDVPETSQVHRQVVRKAHEALDIRIDPIVHPYLVDVPQPDMQDPRGDLERLRQALREQWDIEAAYCDLRVTQGLQKCLREGDWKVTVAIHNGNEIIAVWPGLRQRLHGMAVDVGSTTIAAQLCDLGSGEVLASAGRMNPQIRFGEDLMSRVSYIMMNEGGERELTRVVREAIDGLAGEVAALAGIAVGDIVELTIVGNPVMQHLVLGCDPRALGQAPFALASDAAVSVPARDLEIGIHPGGYAYVLPCIAGHVGADMAGVMLAEAPWARDDMSLLVDVGTNAEIVLGNRERLLAASSPTGPAFEGAQISAGQRAAAGAIERVRIDSATLEPRYRVIGCELWSDEPGFREQVPPGGVTGICGSGIIEVIAELFLAGVIDADGKILDLSGRSRRIRAEGRTFSYVLVEGEPELLVTQTDVRAIQLAKAALYAGCRLLMEELGVERVDRIRLAGAFGSQIDVKYAMVLGMIPDCALERVSSAGNAAGTGARIALLNRSARGLIERQVREVVKIETAVAERFQQHFVEAMALPHRRDSFEELRKWVDLPALAVPRSAGRSRRRARPSEAVAERDEPQRGA
jgi:uncharacterized 2Fe-2S/4Fe-4S cluster protein (DUF4445 family)